MTILEGLLVGGGAALVAAIVAYLIYHASQKKTDQSIDTIETMEFSLEDFKKWNSINNPDNKHKVCIVSAEALQKDHAMHEALKNFKFPENSSFIALAVINDNGDIEKLSIVIYENLSEKLKSILDENGGTIILEE